jgi:hypothetical protein
MRQSYSGQWAVLKKCNWQLKLSVVGCGQCKACSAKKGLPSAGRQIQVLPDEILHKGNIICNALKIPFIEDAVGLIAPCRTNTLATQKNHPRAPFT